MEIVKVTDKNGHVIEYFDASNFSVDNFEVVGNGSFSNEYKIKLTKKIFSKSTIKGKTVELMNLEPIEVYVTVKGCGLMSDFKDMIVKELEN